MARKKRPSINLGKPAPPQQKEEMAHLFASEQGVEQASGLQLFAIRLNAIQPDPEQPRNTFPPESLAELSDSIRQDGVIQPIEVMQMGPGLYQIVHGERRWRA
ncbi:MAG: ParB/RepB/Spo0J family partition protein, partial [Anaerolineales bacterium]|nr:ParB/RepB/Spo0J family partition protein [Anaerolineales bacterium]